MRTILSIFIFTFLAIHSYGQGVNTPVQDELVILNDSTHNFGKIPQGLPVNHIFEIKNIGKTPLVLIDVHASCGCTTPEWSNEPIAPGATAKIKVGFNAASEGLFQKPITITYGNSKTKIINIGGLVWKIPITAAPENASLKFLKLQNL